MSEQIAILIPHTTDIRVGDMAFDLIMSESFSSAVTSTGYAREDGSRVSDGAVLQPKQTTFELLLTDWPKGANEAIVGRARDAFEALKELQQTLEPVNVYTMLHDFGLVHITNVQATQNSKTGYAIPVTISIESVEIVRQQMVDVPADAFAKNVRNSAPKTKEQGKKDKEKPDEKTKKKSSVLYKVFY